MFLGAYGGLLSAGSLCAERILAVPNSRLADDLRAAIGDWQARAPVPQTDAAPSMEDTSVTNAKQR